MPALGKRSALLLLCLIVGACATQPHAGYISHPGIFMGVIHGLLAPLALIAGIFTDARIYAFPNSGWWYDLGFILGISVWAGGGATAVGQSGS